MRSVFLVVTLVSLAGCPPKRATSPHCVSNTELQFKRIDEAVAKAKAGENKPGAVYWSRYYLETARFVLTGKGLDGSGAACSGEDRDSADYDRLIMGLEAREHDVQWLETQRGVTFDGVPPLRWRWQRDGSQVPNDAANTL